jgi:phage shock protein A
MTETNRQTISRAARKWASDTALAAISELPDDAALALAAAIRTLEADLARARKACDAWRQTAEGLRKKIKRQEPPK